MNHEKSLNLLHEDKKITIEGDVFSTTDVDDKNKWTLQPLDAKRFLLCKSDLGDVLHQTKDGIGQLPVEAFADFLSGLHHKNWSGVVLIDNGTGIKKVFFYQGEIVSAASNIIDDRLGEVVFRKGLISLDELADSTVRVTRQTRFGQVLLNQDLFSNLDLWRALKYQVQEIIKSTFMSSSVFFELQSGIHPIPSGVVFTQNTLDIIEDSFTYGAMFRSFCSRLTDDSKVFIVSDDKDLVKYPAGTFFGDLLSLIKEQKDIKTLLKSSKLIPPYTLDTIMSLVNRGVCKINPTLDLNITSNSSLFASIKAKLDAYAFLLQSAKKFFELEQKSIPINELQDFSLSLNNENFTSFFIDFDAEITKDCRFNIFSQCLASNSRIRFFIMRIESLIQFLLQISVDHLSQTSATKIINDYRVLGI